LLAGAVVTAKGHFVAEVFHRYVPSPVSAKQKVEKEAAAQRREAAKEALARSARRGMAGLRREKMAHERTKRLEREMQIGLRRGELVKKEVVLQQAGFLLTALRSRCLAAPSAWSVVS
jgi:hypothetical protein